MRFKQMLMILICATPIILGWTDVSTMSVDYFKANFAKFICLLDCRFRPWTLHFAKTASNSSIGIFYVNIETFDENKLSSCLKQKMTFVGVVLDVRCAEYKDVMLYASKGMLLDANHKWLLIDDTTTDDEKTLAITDEVDKLTTFLEEINLSVDADITIAKRVGAEKFDFREVFNFGKTKDGKFVINELGSWDSNTGLQISKRFKYYRRWNFQNMTLRNIVVMAKYPKKFDEQMVIGRILGSGLNVITQVGATVLHEIADLHNIRYNYTVTDEWIGPFQRNASRVVSNSLFFREQDISPVIRLVRPNMDYFDIVHPRVTSIETKYYYRISSYGAGKFENQFLRPLSPSTWWCVVSVSLACSLVLLFAAVLEKRPSSGQYALFSVFASICQQFFEDVDSVKVKRPSTAGKLTILVTGLFCVLIYNYYTSSVVSWLLNGPPPSINSLEELLESPLKLAYEDVGYTKTWLKLPDYNYNKRNAKVELEMRRKKVWNKKKGEPLMVPLNEGIGLIKAGEYAYHMEVNTANKLISLNFDQAELCEMGSLQSMEPTSLYTAVQRNSPYKEFFTWSIARLSERGLVTCIHKRLLSAPMACEGSSPRALALGGAAPAFILLGVGCYLGLFIMMVERYFVQKPKAFHLINKNEAFLVKKLSAETDSL